eukprot:CAMPEP_0197521326 /NCGR_PEP_ID=MMETSP1318-20131121/6607_1 /TAXON_ID=552666 /ORGANISM="Partenskyella glossopodia, Strain RCC365" /LENGTH=274 /DNA_ID=CAMNT_0043073265 /DNA_START=282 /DNA_END=1106 /DNA_ORIENTATION=+
MLGYFPEFYLKKYILDSFPKGELPATHADAVDFVVEQMETLNRLDLGSRLTLNCLPSSVKTYLATIKKKIPMTILDTVDDVVLPEAMRERLYGNFPHAKLAHVKKGGDFPFLSQHLEISMHIEVHLRGVQLFPGGVDAKTYAKKSGFKRTSSSQEEKTHGNVEVEPPKREKTKKELEAEAQQREEQRKRDEKERKRREEEQRRLEAERARVEAERKKRQEAGNKILANLVDLDDDEDEENEENAENEQQQPKEEPSRGLFDNEDEPEGEADPFR